MVPGWPTIEMRREALLMSAGLHAVAVALLIFGLPYLPQRDFDVVPPPIEVELVRVSEKTTPPPPKVEAPKPDPKPEPPKPEPVRTVPPPPPPPAETPAPKAAEAPRPEPAPAPKPEPPKAAEALPTPVPPQPRAKPQPTREMVESMKDNKFDPNRLAALINRIQKPAAKPQTESEIKSTQTQTTPSTSSLQEPMTISELDLIRRQFERCWNPPAGAKDAANLVVRVRVQLNADGTLRAPPELIDRSRLADGYWRAAAESALRAVQICVPLRNLPPGKYERWRDIELTFNPKDMLG